MAKLQVLAVRDHAVNAFMRPMFMTAIGQALRAFADEVNRQEPNNTMHWHAEDYELWHLGEYTEETGAFEMLMEPNRVARGQEVKTTDRS